MLSNCFQARALRAGLLLSVSVLSRPILADDAIDEVVVQSTTPSHDIARFDLPVSGCANATMAILRR
jgi:hypothetical protein